jgi:hypothetical protein
MSGLRPDDQEPEVLFPLVCGEGEQRPGSEAPTRRPLFGVRVSRSSAEQVLPGTPAEQAT